MLTQKPMYIILCIWRIITYCYDNIKINYSESLVLKSVESPAGQAVDRSGIPQREYPKMVRSRWNKLDAEFPTSNLK